MEKKRSKMVLMNTKPYEIIVNMQIFVTQVSNPHFLQDPQSTQELLKKPTFILGKNLLTNLRNRISGWGTGKKNR